MRVIVLLAMCVFSTTYGGTVVFVQSGEKDTRDVAAPSPDETSLVCPDGSVCSGLSACCRTYLNKYHCCAYPLDVCCDDGLHCCGRLTICDQRTLTCLPGSNSPPWNRPSLSLPAAPAPSLAVPAVKKEAPANLVCPNGSICPGTSACCRTLVGTYSCCSFPNNVCCSDGRACCPRGSICDARTHTCLPGGTQSIPAKPSN
jgi:hypothetical protein